MMMPERKIHLSDPKPAQKKVKKGGYKSFLLILICLGGFAISPAPQYLFSLVPQSFMKQVFSSAFQDIVLDNSAKKIITPQKYEAKSPLPILGHDSGICFTFLSTMRAENKDIIDTNRLDEARRGAAIAEIIAIDYQGNEYDLDEVTYTGKTQISIICQKLNRKYSVPPETIKAIFVRPYKPFTPAKITWATTKKLR